MAYTRQNFVDNSTVLTADMMKHIEDGIVANEEQVNELYEEIANLQTSGLTTEHVNALNGMFKKCAFTSNATAEYEAFKTAFGITGESGGEEEPDTPDNPEVTLTSISATYTGGDVTVGTALTDLTGITVTANYSDGSTANITGYTLSGTIAEGSNTITVSYSGKTTTFTVIGVAESSGGDDTGSDEVGTILETVNMASLIPVGSTNTSMALVDGKFVTSGNKANTSFAFSNDLLTLSLLGLKGFISAGIIISPSEIAVNPDLAIYLAPEAFSPTELNKELPVTLSLIEEIISIILSNFSEITFLSSTVVSDVLIVFCCISKNLFSVFCLTTSPGDVSIIDLTT